MSNLTLLIEPSIKLEEKAETRDGGDPRLTENSVQSTPMVYLSAWPEVAFIDVRGNVGSCANVQGLERAGKSRYVEDVG